jgi:hypothetical protein
MIKKIIMAPLFCLTSSIANANNIIETTKPVVCGPIQAVIKELTEDKEVPVFTGK